VGWARRRAPRRPAPANDGSDPEDWLEIDLRDLRERGKRCGLADFLAEVEREVVPLLAGAAERR
jgi:hypothetical protein